MKWRFLVTGLLVALQLSLGLAQDDMMSDQEEIDDLESQLYEQAEAEAPEDDQLETREFLGYPRERPFQRRHRKRAVLFASKPEVQRAIDQHVLASEEILPHRHPAVAMKLENMNEDLQELQGRQQVAAENRGTLESDINAAVHHMNKAVSIKHKLAKAHVQLRAEERKMRRLEEDRLRLDRTHGHLVSSLHHIMEPKINFAEARVASKERAAKELEADAQHWKDKEQKFHQASLAMLEERKVARRRLEASDEALRKAQREHELAEKEMKAVKHGVDFNLEGYRYAHAEAKASESKAERGEEEEGLAEKSVKRFTNILNMEQRRVDESMAHGKDKVQGKLRELGALKERTTVRLARLEEEYHMWQQEEVALARKVQVQKRRTHDAAVKYAKHHRNVLDKAQAGVAYDAESNSDWAWNDWAKDDNNIDELHLDMN